MGEIAGPERHRDRVVVGILAVGEAVGSKGQIVAQAEQPGVAGQGDDVAGDGEVRHGVEVLGDGVVAGIVGQGVGDAEQVAPGVHVEDAGFQAPATAEVMADLAEAGVGDQVGAGPGLAIAQAGRIDGGRQEGALAAEVDDAAGQSGGIGAVVAGVQLQHRAVVDVDIEVAGRQRPVQTALGDIAFTFRVQHVQPVAERPRAAAEVRLGGVDPGGIEASHQPHQQRIGRTLELIVEHARRRLRTIERAGEAVQHLDPGQAFARHGGGADDVEAIEPRVLHDAALEAPRLGPRHFEALLVANLHGRQIAQGVVHRARLQIDDQVFRHGGDRDRRVEDRLHPERSQIGVMHGEPRLVPIPFAGHHDLAELALGRRGLRLGRSRHAEGEDRDRRASKGGATGVDQA